MMFGWFSLAADWASRALRYRWDAPQNASPEISEEEIQRLRQQVQKPPGGR